MNIVLIENRMKDIQFKKILILISLLGLSACQNLEFRSTPNFPNEAALVANAYANGLETELDISYQKAFQNLRTAYRQCVAFTAEKDFVFTDNKLEEEFEMGTIFTRTEDGAFISKTLVEAIGPNRTRLTLFIPSQYGNVKQRFQRDIQRALGKDSECNKDTID